MHSAYQEIALV